MKKLLSIKYSAGAFNAAMLLLRLGLGVLMMAHGYDKLVNFAAKKNEMINFMGIGKEGSLALVVFAEFFCSIFLILGLFTRFAAIPLIIVTCVIIFKLNNGNVFGDAEMAAVYLSGYLVLLFVGPGKVSVDSMIGK
jgi:putative oxidoreductase